jgi:hypothetical protein
VSKVEGRLETLKTMLNNQIAHLIYDQRTSDESNKINVGEQDELMRYLAPKSREFRAHLIRECAGFDVHEIGSDIVEMTIRARQENPTFTPAATASMQAAIVVVNGPGGPKGPCH